MKTTLTILFLSLAISISAQCVVNAGANRNICAEEFQNNPKLEGAILSGNVVQTKWESSSSFNAVGKSYPYYAADMLSDSSILEPIIKNGYGRTISYYLTGVTADSLTCKDTVIINFGFWVSTLTTKNTGKSRSDTIPLWITTYSNWPIVKYEWSPNFMISDTTVETPLVWNDTTTFYHLFITDSIGCRMSDGFVYVYVDQTSTRQLQMETQLKIYPNPTSNRIHIESKKQILKSVLYSMNGQKLMETKNDYMDLSEFVNATYLIQIHFEDDLIINKLVEKIRE